MAHPLVVQLLLILSGFRVLAASCCNCGVHQSESRCGMLFFYKLGLVAADGGTAEYPKAFLATGQQVGRALFCSCFGISIELSSDAQHIFTQLKYVSLHQMWGRIS